MKCVADLPTRFTRMSKQDQLKIYWKAQRFTSNEIAKRLGVTQLEVLQMLVDIEAIGELDPTLESMMAKMKAKHG